MSPALANVALGALEDVGFAIVSNLPVTLLVDTVDAMLATHTQSLGVSVNAHSPILWRILTGVSRIRTLHPALPLRIVRIDASDQTCSGAFAETRRKHPFASDNTTLAGGIAEERSRLRAVAASAFDIDTSATSTHLLRQRVRQFAAAVAEHAERPLLEISSFAYREGIPPTPIWF